MPSQPKPPVWLDNNILVKIEQGQLADVELEIFKLQQDGHEVLLPKCVEHEFLNGQGMNAADAVKRRAVLARLRVQVDMIANQTPLQQLRAWRDEGIRNGLSIPDANVVAEVRAGGAARGLRNPVLFTMDAKAIPAMQRNGVGALKPRSLSVKPRPLPVRTEVQVHPPETPPEPPLPPPTPPKAGSLPRLRRFANGFAEGIKGAFTAESIAAEIPELILLIADKAATRATVRKIQITFIKAGFAKGVAAGVMGWTKEEVESTLMNRVTAFRVQDLGDPAGALNRTYILQLAEAYENYAVEVGYLYSSSKPQRWKTAILQKGFPLLKRFGYDFHFGDNAEALFQYEFLDKLAWVLTPTTNAIVEPAIRFEGEEPNDPASVAASTPILAGA
jgi:hypothetical protein